MQPRSPIAWCGISLESHSKAVAWLATRLYTAEWERMKRIQSSQGAPVLGPEWLWLAGLLHDAGKAGYTQQALERCANNRAPSFQGHEAIGGLAVALAALEARGNPVAERGLWATSLAALLHHHGMAKPATSITALLPSSKGGKTAAEMLAEALEWLAATWPRLAAGHGPIEAGDAARDAVMAAARRASKDPGYALRRALRGLEDTLARLNSGGDPGLAATAVVAVAAVSVADTLAAGLERNNMDPTRLRGRWVYRLLWERHGPRTDNLLEAIARELREYYS